MVLEKTSIDLAVKVQLATLKMKESKCKCCIRQVALEYIQLAEEIILFLGDEPNHPVANEMLKTSLNLSKVGLANLD